MIPDRHRPPKRRVGNPPYWPATIADTVRYWRRKGDTIVAIAEVNTEDNEWSFKQNCIIKLAGLEARYKGEGDRRRQNLNLVRDVVNRAIALEEQKIA